MRAYVYTYVHVRNDIDSSDDKSSRQDYMFDLHVHLKRTNENKRLGKKSMLKHADRASNQLFAYA